MSWLDLHMHSEVSLDGEYSPKQLAGLCHEKGLKVAALSDHNSVRGVEEMMVSCARFGIRGIPAVELDSTFDGVDLHLLGDGIDYHDSRYAELENRILSRKKEISFRAMKILRDIGIIFEEEKVLALSRNGIVGGETIAEAALADERNLNNPLLLPYRPGGERGDNPYVNFFWDFCSQGKPAYFPADYPAFEEAQQLIEDTGGISVIAHPANTVGKNRDRIRTMVKMGVSGLEVYSSYHTAEDVTWFHRLAEELELLETMGSDFHGKTKPSVVLGGTNARLLKTNAALGEENGPSQEERTLALLDYLLKIHATFR